MLGNETTPEPDDVSFADSVAVYLAEAENSGVLRPHQREVFGDTHEFFASDARRGYINAPTGSGKTVLFVELTKAVQAARIDGRIPRVLIVEPTKDLVHQTLGRNGERGFGRFAPDLEVGSYFSDTPDSERASVADFGVVVTTYQSMRLMAGHLVNDNDPGNAGQTEDSSAEAYGAEPFEAMVRMLGYEAAKGVIDKMTAVRSGQSLLSRFDLVILDEAHHSLGQSVEETLRRLSPETRVVGFTASPDIDDDRKLTNILPYKIHELLLKEAIGMGLLAPVVPVGVRSGIEVRGGYLYDRNGEFLDERLGYLAHDPARNRQIIEAAKRLVENGVPTIVSCIAGDEAWHARHLAEAMRSEGLRAVSVHSKVPAVERQRIYKRYSDGEIDVLTFVGVLGEGWDSSRTKGLINARPTRSQIFAAQRLGRTTRPGSPAYVIDILDDYEERNGPITGVDVLDDGDMVFGQALGHIEDSSAHEQVLHALRSCLPVLDEIPCVGSSYIANLNRMTSGVVRYEGDSTTYCLPSVANRNVSGLTEEIISRYEELHGVHITRNQALVSGRGRVVRVMYSKNELGNMIHSLPAVDPTRYFVDADGAKWASTEGLAKLFSKRYPGLRAEDIEVALGAVGQGVEWLPARMRISQPGARYTRQQIIKLYSTGKDDIGRVNETLRDYFEHG